jgi:hypothetical protein
MAVGQQRDTESPRIDEERKHEEEPLERSGRESRVEDFREQQGGEDESMPSGHRIAGSGSSAESYSYRDRGEEGGASHPAPKDPEDRSERSKD